MGGKGQGQMEGQLKKGLRSGSEDDLEHRAHSTGMAETGSLRQAALQGV